MKLADFVHSQTLNKSEFDARLPGLRAELLEAQNRLRKANFPVIVLFAGVDGAGKSEVVNLLNEWMDPRWLINRAYVRPTGADSDAERPVFRRYWQDLPPKGQIGLFLSAWYSQVLLGTVNQRVTVEQFPRHVERIRRFERTLATDGALILKFWMHLDKRHQKKQLKRLESDPATAWRVTHTDWAHWAMYNRFVQAGDQIIDATDTALAPWRVVDGADHRYRSITIAQHLLDAIQERLSKPSPGLATEPSTMEPTPPQPFNDTQNDTRNNAAQEPAETLRLNSRTESTSRTEPTKGSLPEDSAQEDSAQEKTTSNAAPSVPDTSLASVPMGYAPIRSDFEPSRVNWLASVDLNQTLPKKMYRIRLAQSQGELNRLCRRAKEQNVSSLLAFEGWDAAGKGGSIRRILQALDPRNYRVIPTAAPTEEENSQHYLWRFWRHLPSAGNITIFDRSWYGRVLVERIEGFARSDEWQRAYKEINEFEQELVESGILICKYWLHITPDEQLRRFEERQNTPHKRWKLTDEDWRNREKWNEYEDAVNDMIQRTNTPLAPWTIVSANDKYTARIQVLDTVCEHLRANLAKSN